MTKFARAAYQPLWRKFDPALSLEAPELRRLLNLWEERRGARSLPGRPDFSADELMSFGGRIMLIDVEHEPRRYKFRLIGTFIVDMLSRDVTGRYLEEVYPPDYYEQIIQSLEYCIEKRRPMRAQSKMSHAEKDHIIAEVIDLPLSSDGETVDMIMKAGDYADAVE